MTVGFREYLLQSGHGEQQGMLLVRVLGFRKAEGLGLSV